MKHPISFKISVGYAFFGVIWLLLAHPIIALLLQKNIASIGILQAINSILFFCTMTILLYNLIGRIEASQKQNKDELDTYKHLVSASIDGLMLADKSYRIKAISRVWAKVLGRKTNEVIGNVLADILGPEHFEKEIKHRAERCMAGEKVRAQIWASRPNGRQGLYDVIYYPHFERTKKGEITGFVVSARDITDIHQMERKLRQAYKMEAIGTLAGGIAHDFNNILMVILLHAEITLKRTKAGSDLHKSLSTILEAGQRAADLVKQILTFSRQGEQELYPVQIHLVVKEAAKFMRASLPATIEIKTKIESTSLVLADPTQIHQVIMNLCTNAGHALKDKGGILTITLNNVELDQYSTQFHPRLKPGHYVKLSVSDTGTGIPPEIMDRIFDPFFTTKEKGEGTGMGLSVVHGIVESCGGSISVYSEPNQGANFYVYLPIMEIQADQKLDQQVPIPRGSETVLFVDDEVKLVDAGQQTLEQLGYKVITSTSGKEAFEKFSQNPQRFDLVITDLTMPYMKGDELARKIRRLRPNVPILMITGLIPQTTAESLKSAQVDELIMKPLTTREIATAIRQVLNDKPSENKG